QIAAAEEARYTRPGLEASLHKQTSDQYFAIVLDEHGVDGRVCETIEGLIQTPILTQSRDVASPESAESSKIPGNNDHSVWLKRQRLHLSIKCRTRHESAI